MGKLHFENYVEQMKRQYGVAYTTGRPQVAFCETVTERAEFVGGARQHMRMV